MPTLDPKIFKNMPWRKTFYDAIYKSSETVQISDKGLDGVYQVFAAAYRKDFATTKAQLIRDRSFIALIPGRKNYYLSNFIARYIVQCQFMLLGQSDLHKLEICAFYHNLIVNMLKAFYAEIHASHEKNDIEYYDEYWDFIEISINESIALNYDGKKLLQDSAKSNLYSIYMQLLRTPHASENFPNNLFLQLLAVDAPAQLKAVNIIYDIIFSQPDNSIVKRISSIQMENHNHEIAKFHNDKTQSSAFKFNATLSVIAAGIVIGFVFYLIAPDILAAYLYYYCLALIATAGSLYLWISRHDYRELKSSFLLSEYKNALKHESTLADICNILDIDCSRENLDNFVYKIRAVLASKKMTNDPDLMGMCFLISRELNQGVFRLKRQEIIIEPNQKPIVVHSCFDSHNQNYHIPDGLKLPTIKKHLKAKANKPENKQTEAATIPLVLKLSKQQKQGGALIQGVDHTNNRSAIYLRLPNPESQYEEELNTEISQGIYTFVAGKNQQGFKYSSTYMRGNNQKVDCYRFKLFDKNKTRWNFRRDGEISVKEYEENNSDSKTEKVVPRYAFYKRGKK